MDLHGGGQYLISDRCMDVFNTDEGAEKSVRFSTCNHENHQNNPCLELKITQTKQGMAFEYGSSGSELAEIIAKGQTPKTYFRIVDENAVKDTTLPSLDTVRQLAFAMKMESRVRDSASRAPAAFTYLGQFIAHDMTHMKFNGDPTDPKNYRSHALDLDSVFSNVDLDCDLNGTFLCDSGICLGQSRGGQYADLPRSETGEPCISDQRNDNNLALSQVTVEIMKFFHSVGKLCNPKDVEEQKQITLRHFHSIVLHDYLKKICHDQVYQDIMANGRRIVFPGGLANSFRVPIEFAAACFRFGHSQIRSVYDWNAERSSAKSPSSSDIRDFTFIGGGIHSNKPQLPDNWIIDWNRFLGSDSADPVRHFAATIDWNIPTSLSQLPSKWIDDPDISPGKLLNLAQLTLERSVNSRVPTAQLLRKKILPQLPADSPEHYGIPHDDLFTGSAEQLKKHLSDTAVQELSSRTPLWFYILREAEIFGVGGRHLGPFCSRIVAETIHASVEATSGNIIGAATFRVNKKLRQRRSDIFTFVDMLDVNKSINF